MGRRVINSLWNRDNLLNMNYNFEELYNHIRRVSNVTIDIANDNKLTPQQFQDLQITLNGLLKKGDLSVKDINYNLGKIGLSELSDDVIKAISGNANVNAVTADGSIVTPKLASDAVAIEKTAFVKTGKNLFRVNEVTRNYSISNTTGELISSQYYVASAFEPIKPSTDYVQNYGEAIAFYDINKQFVLSLIHI